MITAKFGGVCVTLRDGHVLKCCNGSGWAGTGIMVRESSHGWVADVEGDLMCAKSVTVLLWNLAAFLALVDKVPL